MKYEYFTFVKSIIMGVKSVFYLFVSLFISSLVYSQQGGVKSYNKKEDKIVHLYSGEVKAYTDAAINPKQVQRITWQNTTAVSMPEAISAFVNVEEIDISHNKITSLKVADFSLFKKLKRVYLNGNPLNAGVVEKLRAAYPQVLFVLEKTEGK